MTKYFAHSLEGEPPEKWQPLEEHLQNVSMLAAEFAAYFDAKDWGRCVGILHDYGKATAEFQARLAGSPAKVDHSTIGARLARDKGGRLGLLMAYVVAGHHGGLPDGGEQETQLHFRLKHAKIHQEIALLPKVDIPEELILPFRLTQGQAGFALSFFTRMIYSCLVDADFLDTERFCATEKARERRPPAGPKIFPDLQQKLNVYLDTISREAAPTLVNSIRKSILSQCREKAKLPPQIFSLTVPTGGGKTLSSMNFALDHAVLHGQRRVIYAIPFTSIIEQNAKVFQDIFGREHVLEHHCNFKELDGSEQAAYNLRRGLATENWETPIVVTTNVQFFESLFSNKPSRCRKLHNIARSVIVLDEAQAIPTEYLEPCLAALNELVKHYGCSVVLCTATQPAFDDKSNLRMALPKVAEIVDNPAKLYKELQRTEIGFIGQITEDELAARMEQENQVLCIVSTKLQARTLFEKLEKSDSVFHLSTNLYPLHRRRILDEIRQRLKKKQSCRVVSTSLVEAGVDLDFPVVYRAMAGLDSIAQAAGRCNREGKMEVLGKVYAFESEKPARMPWIKRCISRAEETLRSLPNVEPLELEAMRRYFELLYDVQDLDRKQILNLLNPKLGKELFLPFKEAAQAFHFIEEENVGVIVAIEPETRKLVHELRYAEFPRATLRKLQQYSVALRRKDFTALDAAGALEMIHGEFPLLCNEAAYQNDIGLCVDYGEVWRAEDLIK